MHTRFRARRREQPGVCKGKAWFIPPRVRPGESRTSQYGTSLAQHLTLLSPILCSTPSRRTRRDTAERAAAAAFRPRWPHPTTSPRVLWPGPSTEERRRPRKDLQAVKAMATASNSKPPLPPLPRAPSCLRPTLLVQDTDPRCVDVVRCYVRCLCAPSSVSAHAVESEQS